MGYAKHIGRVGALAVALGIGVAVATTGGIAYAEPVGSQTSTQDSPSASSSSPTGAADAGSTTADDVTAETQSPAEQPEADAADADSADADVADDNPAEDDDSPADTAEGADVPNAADTGSGEEAAAVPPASDDEPADPDTADSAPPAQPDDATHHSVSGRSPITTDAEDTEPATEAEQQAPVSTKQAASDPASDEVNLPSTTTFAATSPTTTSAITTSAAETTAPIARQPRPTIVTVVRDLVAAVLRPLLSWGTGSPIQLPTLFAGLAMVRDEMERVIFGRTTKVASEQTVSALVEPTDQHVLVIGVDGTNLSRILADPANTNFFEMMDTSTTAASSIVGHTTISNPSWTTILTGAWDNKTGVINNVFTPWTYDKWSTVFNQLETFDPDIRTKAIADWDVTAAIPLAGSQPADESIYVPRISGDTNWSLTDRAVTEEAVRSILGTDAGYEDVPNFMFTYLVQVDENGHMFGGASPEYAQAIERTDANLGLIMDAVAAREAATGEDWTVIVVTDHGHQPQKGFGHGFQTPSETATFVMVDGPGFGDGLINTEYEIVDVTPTVVTLFGATPASRSDGVSLTTLAQFDIDPVDLHQALQDQIAKNHSPDIITDIALSARTIFATIPYYVFTELGSVPILGDILYVATNIPAQIVAFLTGVHGARLFPLLPPEPPFSTQDPAGIVADCVGDDLAAAGCVAV